jgi:hypothetical protein
MKDSAFFPFLEPEATSARRRSPADMCTRLNCTETTPYTPAISAQGWHATHYQSRLFSCLLLVDSSCGLREMVTLSTIFWHCVPFPAAGAPAIITFKGWPDVIVLVGASVATCARELPYRKCFSREQQMTTQTQGRAFDALVAEKADSVPKGLRSTISADVSFEISVQPAVV